MYNQFSVPGIEQIISGTTVDDFFPVDRQIGLISEKNERLVSSYNQAARGMGMKVRFRSQPIDNRSMSNCPKHPQLGSENLFSPQYPVVTDLIAEDTLRFWEIFSTQKCDGWRRYVTLCQKETKAGKTNNILHIALFVSALNYIYNKQITRPLIILTPRVEGLDGQIDPQWGCLRFIAQHIEVSLPGCQPLSLSNMINAWEMWSDQIVSKVEEKMQMPSRYIHVRRIGGEKEKKIFLNSLQHSRENNHHMMIIPDEADEGAGANQLQTEWFRDSRYGESLHDQLKKKTGFFSLSLVSATLKAFGYGEAIDSLLAMGVSDELKLREEECYRHLRDVPRITIGTAAEMMSMEGKVTRLGYATSPQSHPYVNERVLAKVLGREVTKKDHMAYRKEAPETLAWFCMGFFNAVYRIRIYHLTKSFRGASADPYKSMILRYVVSNEKCMEVCLAMQNVLGDRALVIPYCCINDKRVGKTWKEWGGSPKRLVEKLIKEGETRPIIMLVTGDCRRTVELPDNCVFCTFAWCATTESTLSQEVGRATGNNVKNTLLVLSEEYDGKVALYVEGKPTGLPIGPSTAGKSSERGVNLTLVFGDIDKVTNPSDRQVLQRWRDGIANRYLNRKWMLECLSQERIVRGGWFGWKKSKAEGEPQDNWYDLYSDKVRSAIERNHKILFVDEDTDLPMFVSAPALLDFNGPDETPYHTPYAKNTVDGKIIAVAGIRKHTHGKGSKGSSTHPCCKDLENVNTKPNNVNEAQAQIFFVSNNGKMSPVAITLRTKRPTIVSNAVPRENSLNDCLSAEAHLELRKVVRK